MQHKCVVTSSIMNKLYCFVVLIKVLSDIHWSSALELELYETCAEDGAICVKLNDCPDMKKAIKNGSHPSICSFQGNEPIVCCTEDLNKETFLDKKSVSAQKCDLYRRTNCPQFATVVFGGTEAKRKEFPFMALIGYGTKDNKAWRCGGSLISTRWILSAAHCSQTDDKGPARWARLGELDTAIENESEHQDFTIIKIIDHPAYKPPAKYNDIALYQLDRESEISLNIRPICLDQSPDISRYKNAVATGWGSLGFAGPVSKKLMKGDLDVFHVNKCRKTGADKRQLPRGILEESMICAGKENGETDTCPGDSGGPLFLPRPDATKASPCYQYQQIGITSFGYQCAVAGYPGVYTKVYPYLKWIESIVWPPNTPIESPSWTS